VAVATLDGRVAIPDDVRTLHLERLGRNKSIVPPSDVPRKYPLFDGLRVDELHRLWVERFASDGGHRFEVFSVTGAPVAQLDIPRDIDLGRPMVIAHDYIYAFGR
jgi:sugar lactone lactonase YvrE